MNIITHYYTNNTHTSILHTHTNSHHRHTHIHTTTYYLSPSLSQLLQLLRTQGRTLDTTPRTNQGIEYIVIQDFDVGHVMR